MRAGDLLDHEGNPWLHPAQQQAQVRGLLNEVGIVDSLKAWRSARLGGRLATWDGHLRKTLHPDQMWPVAVTDLTDAEADLLVATYNRSNYGIELDGSALAALLETVQAEDAAVLAMLEGMARDVGLFAEGELPPGAGGDDFDVEGALDAAENGPTRACPGDLWQLGRHRLLVGDATDRGEVARLFDSGREQADLIFTDPPYGVAYVGGTKEALTILNDNLGDAGTRMLVANILRAAPLRPGGVFYVCSPAGNTETAFRLAIADAGLLLRQCLVWVKQQFVLGRQDYHWRHESILYGWKEGAAHFFVEDRTQDTVWEIDRPQRNADHPTMKPIALVERALANSSRVGELVYDACGGSGTTLIACERQGRRARLCELDPKYATVILNRFETETGAEAVLLARTAPAPPSAPQR